MRAAMGPILDEGIDFDIRHCRVFVDGFRVMGALVADDTPEGGVLVPTGDNEMTTLRGRVAIKPGGGS